MKQTLKILIVSVTVIVAGIIGLFTVFWIFDPTYPSESIAREWEKNYRNEITNEVTDFEGHWLDSDIAAYIYSYKQSSGSIAEHQARLIKALKDFRVIERDENVLVLRRSVTYSQPDGFDEWRFLFDQDTKLVTVLFANLDSELWAHADLVKRTNEYHQKRKLN